MKTEAIKLNEIQKKWYIVDLKDQVLGRASSQIALVLRGKNKANFTPNMDMGDFVVVINADKVKLTGTKWKNKIYYRHTKYLGGLKTMTATEMLHKHPEQIVELAVRGMLPKNSLNKHVIKHLKICIGSEHPYAAQKPEVLTLRS